MARPKKYDEVQVLGKASKLFASLGFNATGVDELIRETGLQRGSIYQAFGSKRGLFLRALQHSLTLGWQESDTALDLMIVALKELAGQDEEIRQLCRNAIVQVWDSDQLDASQVFGQRLLKNLER